MAGSMLAVHWVTFFLAVKISGVAVATLGFASFQAFITLCDCVFFTEKISIGEWLILLLVTLGLVLITPSFDLKADATIDVALAILSGLTSALFTLTNRCAAARHPSLTLACAETPFVLMLTL